MVLLMLDYYFYHSVKYYTLDLFLCQIYYIEYESIKIWRSLVSELFDYEAALG